MATFIGGHDYYSKGEPSDWAAAVLDAKAGDAEAVVMLDTGDPACTKDARICELVKMFPYHLNVDGDVDDFVVARDAASDLVATACDAFIPG